MTILTLTLCFLVSRVRTCHMSLSLKFNTKQILMHRLKCRLLLFFSFKKGISVYFMGMTVIMFYLFKE